MKARAVVATVVSVIVLGTAAAGWAWSTRPRTDRAGAGAAIDVGVTEFAGRRGVALPPVTGRTIYGRTLSLSDLRGNVLVLNFWGSWCAPCRAEAPILAAISQQTASRGVRFVGIDVRDDPASAREFERGYGITYPSLADPQGLVLAEFAGVVPVSAIPSTLVVDPAGVIRARVIGKVDAPTLRRLIKQAEQAG